MTLAQNLRRVFTREVVAVCAIAFLADVVSGIISPTFSLYAKSLGASLAIIGALSGFEGLTRLVSSVPIGSFSDSKGRKNVMSLGLFLFALSSFLYVLAPNAYWLFPIRLLAGLAGVSTWFIGVAYLGDIVAKRDRGLVIGVYTTCMGTGFTVGPLIGGTVAGTYGFPASYFLAGLVALIGFMIARRGLSNRVGQPGPQARINQAPPVPLGAKLGLMLKDPNLLAASLGNLLSSSVYAAVFNFFSLYAASLAVGESAIAYMFAIRAFMSTLARLPTGLLTTRLPSRYLMFLSLALALVMVLAISTTAAPVLLGILLAGEGLSYGIFLTAGHAFVTEHSNDSNRGTAIAVYSTVGSFSALGPFLLGVIADLWGLTAVFLVMAALVFGGLCLLVIMTAWQRRVAMPKAERPVT